MTLTIFNDTFASLRRRGKTHLEDALNYEQQERQRYDYRKGVYVTRGATANEKPVVVVIDAMAAGCHESCRQVLEQLRAVRVGLSLPIELVVGNRPTRAEARRGGWGM